MFFAGTYTTKASRYTNHRIDGFSQIAINDTTVVTTATTNAKLTVAGSFQTADTWQDCAISTVDYIVTSNLEIGTMLWITVDGPRTIVFSNDGNIAGTDSTVTSLNTIGLIMVDADKFVRL
jgi:hypothetical protein